MKEEQTKAKVKTKAKVPAKEKAEQDQVEEEEEKSCGEECGEEASSGACCAGVHRSPGAWGSGGGFAPSRNRREAPRFSAPSSPRNGG